MKKEKMKTNKTLYCVQLDLSKRIILFLLGAAFVLFGLFFIIFGREQSDFTGILYLVGFNLFSIVMGLFLVYAALLCVRVYPGEIFKVRRIFCEKTYRLSEVKKVVIKNEYAGMGNTKTYRFYTNALFPVCKLTAMMENAERFYYAAIAYGAKTQKK